MTGKETQFPCTRCGKQITKSGSSCGQCFDCGDKSILEWPKLKAVAEAADIHALACIKQNNIKNIMKSYLDLLKALSDLKGER